MLSGFPEGVVKMAIGSRYVDEDGRVFEVHRKSFVWATYGHKIPSSKRDESLRTQILKRKKSVYLPGRATYEQAQADLDAWAAKKS